MKSLRIIQFVVFLCAVACTKEVPHTPDDTDNLLLMNAQIDAAMTSHKVWLGLSKTTTIGRLDNATVICFVNGEEVSRGIFDEMASVSAIQSCYSFEAELHPGDIIRLSAERAELSAYAEVTVPNISGRLLGVDTLSTATGMRFISRIQDDASENNLYRIRLVVNTSLSYYYDGRWSRWYEHSDEKVIEHSNDPILDREMISSVSGAIPTIIASSRTGCLQNQVQNWHSRWTIPTCIGSSPNNISTTYSLFHPRKSL